MLPMVEGFILAGIGCTHWDATGCTLHSYSTPFMITTHRKTCARSNLPSMYSFAISCSHSLEYPGVAWYVKGITAVHLVLGNY